MKKYRIKKDVKVSRIDLKKMLNDIFKLDEEDDLSDN